MRRAANVSFSYSVTHQHRSPRALYGAEQGYLACVLYEVTINALITARVLQHGVRIRHEKPEVCANDFGRLPERGDPW